MTTASFDATTEDRDLIAKIVARAEIVYGHLTKNQRLNLTMDITAAHANNQPLRLADLLAADDFNFRHDLDGISKHLDRSTGKLTNHFLPRFSRAVVTALALLLSSSLATAADKPAKPRERPQLTVSLKVYPISSPRWVAKDRLKSAPGKALRVTTVDADSCTCWVSSEDLLKEALAQCQDALMQIDH